MCYHYSSLLNDTSIIKTLEIHLSGHMQMQTRHFVIPLNFSHSSQCELLSLFLCMPVLGRCGVVIDEAFTTSSEFGLFHQHIIVIYAPIYILFSAHAVFLLLLGSLTSAIRNYAKCLESWLMGSMTDIPQKMVDVKVSYQKH